VRLVLSVMLAVGLLAAVAPAVEEARRDRAVGAVEGDVAAIEAADRSLAATDEATGADVAGARRVVTVRIPPRSATTARIRYVAIGSVPGRAVADSGDEDVVAVATDSREPRLLRVDADLRVDGRDDRALLLREAGRHRLLLTPSEDGEALAVRRVDGATETAGDVRPAVDADSSAMARPDGAMDPFAWFDTDDGDCRCRVDRDDGRLTLTADDCPGDGDLADSHACRHTAIEASTARDATTVVSTTAGLDRVYDGVGGELLRGAGRFVERVAAHDAALADRAREAPLTAARDACARAGAVASVARDTGLAALSEEFADLSEALSPLVGLSMAGSLVDPVAPDDGRLREVLRLPTGATVRLYALPDEDVDVYHLAPVGPSLTPRARRTLVTARERLAAGAVGGGDRAPGRAVRAVAQEDDSVERLAGVLARHTRGYGVVESVLADEDVEDVYVTAPVDRRRIRLVRDGRTYRTNVRLTRDGARTIASRLRRASGRPFSRASPTVDTAVGTADGERVRVAGLTDPVSDGPAFAIRRGADDVWTLPKLVATRSLTADAAAILSVAVRRGAATLIAGPRGAGKTTTLGALLWEFPGATRAVVIEDTPELPVGSLGAAGRDVQRMRASTEGNGTDPEEALRSALRLGEGALVLGEIRGSEAETLFEAMRVGASGGAVLGTVHGEGGTDVCNRVVEDLGVSPAAFAATDLVVTLSVRSTESGRKRTLASIEERRPDGGFTALYDRSDGDLARTGRIDRGASHLFDDLAGPAESYAAIRSALADRRDLLAELARDGRTDPDAVTTAYAMAEGACRA